MGLFSGYRMDFLPESRSGLTAASTIHVISQKSMINIFSDALNDRRKEVVTAFHSAIFYGRQFFKTALEKGSGMFCAGCRSWTAGPFTLKEC